MSTSTIEVQEEPISRLEEYASISMALTVDRIFELTVRDRGLGGFELNERPVPQPYIKDYDAHDGDRVLDWTRKFDLTNWGLLSARLSGRWVGGAVIAFNTEGVNMLEGRDDLAVLWDLRVRPEMRGKGIGSALFAATERWATAATADRRSIQSSTANGRG